MKIAILGAGAMGCYFGGYLSLHHEVILLDSSKVVVDKIRQEGVSIEETNHETKIFKNVRACVSGTFKEKVDIVLVLVKTCFTQNALDMNASLFDKDTIVLTLQNGMGNQQFIQKCVVSKQILTGTTTNNCVSLAPGKIRHSGQGMTTFGSDVFPETAKRLSKLFLECSLENTISADIKKILWNKLFVNVSINCFTAIFQTPIHFMAENEHAWECAKCVIHEAVLVARADGCDVEEKAVLQHIHHVMIEQGSGYSSMSQDCKNHRKMEIDTINGAVVNLGKGYGIPTPYNSLMVHLIHSLESAYEFH